MPAKLTELYLADNFTALGGNVLRGLPLSRRTELNTVQRRDGNDTLDGVLPRTFDAESWLPQTQILKLIRANGVIEEWPLLTWSRQYPTRRVAVSCAPARSLLRDHVLMVVVAGTDVLINVEAINLTATQILDQYIIPRCPAGIVRGVVGPTQIIPSWKPTAGNGLDATLSLIDAANNARISALDPLSYFSFERDSDTQWSINIRNSFTDVPVSIALPKNLNTFLVEENRIDQRTQYLPVTSNQDTAALCWWRIKAISGTNVTLNSWDMFGGTPIGFDGQLNGDYLLNVDGTTTYLITASVAATQVVTVSSVGSLSVGDIIGLARDASGNRKVVWTDPGNAITKADPLTVTDASTRINWAQNAKFDHWTSGLPDGWSVSTLGGIIAGGTIAQETNPTFIETPPGVFSVSLSGANVGAGTFPALEQTWPMPAAMRNRVWSVRVRVSSTSNPYTVNIGIHTARGWTVQQFSGLASGLQWLVLTVDESAAGLGAWTGGAGFLQFAGPLWVDRVEFVEGDTTDSVDVTYGCGPNRLIEVVNLTLGLNRNPAKRYEIALIDRGRKDPTRYPNDVLTPLRRVRPMVEAIDDTLDIIELRTDELHVTKTAITVASELPRLTDG